MTTVGVRCLEKANGRLRKLPLFAANWGTKAVCLRKGCLGGVLDLFGWRSSSAGEYKVYVVHPKSYVHVKNYVALFRWFSVRLQ